MTIFNHPTNHFYKTRIRIQTINKGIILNICDLRLDQQPLFVHFEDKRHIIKILLHLKIATSKIV